MAPLVPQLWDLHGAHLLRLRKAEEELIHADAGFEEVLGQDRGLGELAEVVDHGLALGDQVKVVGELLRILHQRVVRPGDARVLKAVGCHFLLPRLHAHLHKGDEDAVLRHLDLRLSHDEPLARLPLIGAADIREVKATLHPHDGLGLLAHRKLLQVVVRLEEHVADACACQPRRLEALGLHRLHRVHGLLGGVDRVKGEARLRALLEADLECQGQVLQVHRSCRVRRGRKAKRIRAVLELQAAEPAAHGVALQLPCRAHVPGDHLRPPTNLILRAALRLHGACLGLAVLRLLAEVLLDHLRHAVRMHEALVLLAACVGKVSHGQAAVAAEDDLLLLGVLGDIKVPCRHLAQVPRAALLRAGRCELGTRIARGLRESADRREFLLERCGGVVREGPRARSAKIAWVEPHLRLALGELHAYCDKLAAASVLHHLAVEKAASLQADLIADVEAREGRVLAEASGVGKGRLKLHRLHGCHVQLSFRGACTHRRDGELHCSHA
mmetsp:Transcript_73439/g.195126  ORF Transcript_73439/g.195126 Transcript_73439/m.195126 type:complete len:499 (+) Transcript_73439:1530-3026(+)